MDLAYYAQQVPHIIVPQYHISITTSPTRDSSATHCSTEGCFMWYVNPTFAPLLPISQLCFYPHTSKTAHTIQDHIVIILVHHTMAGDIEPSDRDEQTASDGPSPPDSSSRRPQQRAPRPKNFHCEHCARAFDRPSLLSQVRTVFNVRPAVGFTNSSCLFIPVSKILLLTSRLGYAR